MQIWVLLLRAINVGGNNILPMKDLKSILENLDCQNIQTYIQSGNCVFNSNIEGKADLEVRIGDAINAEFGFRPTLIFLTQEELLSRIANNPYAEVENAQKNVHLFFLENKPYQFDETALLQIALPSEKFTLIENCLYLHAPEGVGRSKLFAKIPKSFGIEMTGRNLNTVQKIMELACS